MTNPIPSGSITASEPAGSSPRHRRTHPTAWAGSATLSVAGATLSCIFHLHAPQRAAACALLSLGCLQLANSGVRVVQRHWRLPAFQTMLTYELLLLGALPLAAGSAMLADADPPAVELMAFAVALGLASLVIDPLEARVGAALAAAGERSVTQFVADLERPVELFLCKPRTSVAEALEEARAARIPQLALWLLTTPPGQHLSKVRLGMTAVLVFGACGFATGPVVALMRGEEPEPSTAR